MQAQATTNEIIWEWRDGTGWHQYESDVGKYIEQEFQKNNSRIDIFKIPGFNSPYFIDIQNMSQQRVDTGTKRSIRRIELLQKDSCKLTVDNENSLLQVRA